MNRRHLSVAAILLASSFAATQAQEIVPANRPVVVIPNSRVLRGPEAPDVRLEKVEATVHVEDQLATTTMRLTLRNNGGGQARARIIAPVPLGASIRFFQLEGLGSDAGAKLLPREEARQRFEEIVRRMQDPAILEFLGMGLVQSDIFPIPPNGTQSIVLTYEELLTRSGGSMQYLLPRSEALSAGGPEWEITATIENGDSWGPIYSPTHDLDIEDRAGRKVVRVTSTDEAGPLRLVFVERQSGGRPAATLLTHADPDHENEGWFLFLAQPPQANDLPTMKREVTIVIDRSGSMRGKKLAQVQAAAMQVLGALDPGETFNIIDYSDTINRFASAPVEVSEQSLKDASEYLSSIRAIGGTNIHDALVAALSQPTPKSRLPVVLFLTDGLPTAGRTSESEILHAAIGANNAERRIFSFGVGVDVNAPLLTAVANDTRGTCTFVLPDEDVEVKVGAVFEQLYGPTLAAPTLNFASDGDVRIIDVVPAAIPDVFEGDQLMVVGRYRGAGAIRITLAGEAGGRNVTSVFEREMGAQSESGRAIARLWANRRIGILLDQIRRSGASGGTISGETDELVNEVVRLSMSFGILTEYTAFLAAEETVRLDEVALQREAQEAVRTRTFIQRSGAAAVSQDINNSKRLSAYRSIAPAQQEYFDADADGRVRKQRITNLRQAGSSVLVGRADRWVDVQLLGHEQEPPEEIVEFASDRYFGLVRELASSGRQALLAQRGDVYLQHRGQRILVRNPS